MTDKPEYYAVLGVPREASLEDIKKAYQKIVMRNHPDVIRNKPNMTEAQKAEAAQKFKEATEANGVLGDAAKRAAYDKYGHKGVENLEAGKGASSGQSYADVAGPVHKRTYSEEDTFDFFSRRSGGQQPEKAPSRNEEADRDAAAAARRKRREERRENGGFAPVQDMPTTPVVERPVVEKPAAEKPATPAPKKAEAPSVAEKFRDTAREMDRTAESLQGGVVPVEVLEQFRENLRDFMGELDKAIARAKKQHGGPSL